MAGDLLLVEVNEYRDPEVGPLLDRIDEIKRKAGSAVHVNQQCRSRQRAASPRCDVAARLGRLGLGYWKDGDDRYLTVVGRQVGLDEGRVRFNGDGRLEFEEGTQADRSRAKAHRAAGRLRRA